MNMVNKVADAIRDNIEAGLPKGVGVDFHYAAVAAIQAMEIPSAEMINAGINCDDWADGEQDATKLVASTFSAMIKEAIK